MKNQSASESIQQAIVYTSMVLGLASILLFSNVSSAAETKGLAKCTSMVIHSVDTEDAPAAIESCYDVSTRTEILACGKNVECVRSLTTDDES